MAWISKQKFFNRYLPMFLLVVLIVGAVFGYLIFEKAQVVEAAPVLLQHRAIGGGTASLAYSSPNIAHHLLIAYVTNTAPTINTPTDTAGNTWLDAGAGAVLFDGSALSEQVFYVPDSKAGANTVTSSGSFAIHLEEWSGILNSSPVDNFHSAANQTAAAGSNNMSSGVMTTTTNGDLVVAYGAALNGPISAGNTLAWNPSADGDVNGLNESLTQVTAGSITATETSGFGSGELYAMIEVAFKASPSSSHVLVRGGGGSGGKVNIRGGGGGVTTPTYVQGCVNSGNGTVTCAMGSNITAGNLLVVTTKGDWPNISANTSSGVSCSWNQIFGPTLYLTSGASKTNAAQFYCNVPSSGAETVSITWSGTGANYNDTFSDIEVAEYSNASGFVIGGLDKTSSAAVNSGSGGVGTCSTGSTATLAQANELVIATCDTWNSAQTWDSVAGYTNEATASRNTSGWYDASVSSTAGVSWSKSITSDASVGFIATFELASTGGGSVKFR